MLFEQVDPRLEEEKVPLNIQSSAKKLNYTPEYILIESSPAGSRQKHIDTSLKEQVRNTPSQTIIKQESPMRNIGDQSSTNLIQPAETSHVSFRAE